MAQGIHLKKRGQASHITKIIGIGPLGQGGAGLGLSANNPQVRFLSLDFIFDKGQECSGEIGTPPNATHDNIGIGAGLLHLLHCFLADYGLMEENMVEHAAQGILRIIMGGSIFHGFADRHPQASRRIRVLGENVLPGFGVFAGAGHAFCSPAFHQDPPIGLLLVTDPDHVDLAFQPEEHTAHGEGAPPLSRTGLRGQTLNSFFLIVIGLGNGRIGLVAPRRAATLILVENLCRRVQLFF